MERVSELKYLHHAPLPYLVVKSMFRHNVRGRWRLNTMLKEHGYFNGKVVKFDLKPNYGVYVPLYRREQWDLTDLLEYENGLVDALVGAAKECVGPITMVDCGADIGLMSVKVAARVRQVSRIVALEPSDEAFPVLERTLGDLPVETKGIQIGVSDFTGRGELRSPPYDASHHARYLAQVSEGGFPVTTIDDLGIKAANVLLKIDVEGGELGVIRGAARTLAGPARAIVSVEAHPKVFARTGIDPIAILREIAAIRPFTFLVAEAGTAKIDLSLPFFDQLPNDGTIYNIVCSSR
jgi:FkbM family methyltransferase